MPRIAIFLMVILPLSLFAQENPWEEQAARVELRQQNQQRRIEIEKQRQQDRLWRQVSGGREEGQPDRSVAAVPNQQVPDPGYSQVEEVGNSVARTASVTIQPEFLGERIAIRAEQLPDLNLGRNVNESSITEAYQALSRYRIPVLLSDLKQQAQRRKLNDWGFLQWVHAATGAMYPGNEAARNLATASIMQQSGYRATVSYSGSHVNLLVKTDQKLFGHSFLNVSGERMYVVNPLGDAPDIRSAYLFDPPQSRRGKPIDMRIREAPALQGSIIRRPVEFKYFGRTFRGELEINRRVAQFYYHYPLVDWSVYVAAPISREALQSVEKVLAGPLEAVQPRRGWTKKMEQANLILHFIQHAFPYRADGEAIGEEHYAFAEEMLALPYSDCEDRSALYVTLVRELLNLEAVGLLFPGHAAAGINFGPNADGDAVNLDGTRYIICDPSYIGADIGRSLPQVRGQRLTVVGR